MNEGIFTIEIGSYGFMLDTQWCYVALSWKLIVTATLLTIAYKALKAYKRNRVMTYPDETCTNSKWGSDEQTTYYTSAVIYCYPRPYHATHDVEAARMGKDRSRL